MFEIKDNHFNIGPKLFGERDVVASSGHYNCNSVGMPARKQFINPEGPFHVSTRCINKEWFSLSMDDVWEIFTLQLYFLNHAFGFQINSFVLMSNHYHMILSSPQNNLSEGMAYFHREVSRELNRQGNRLNRTFAGRFYATELSEYHYFMNCYKYIYQNPLRANLVSQCEQYKYSTLRGLLGLDPIMVPMAGDQVLFNGELEGNLDWLNTLPREEDVESIRRALKRRVFKLPRQPGSKRKNRLEECLL